MELSEVDDAAEFIRANVVGVHSVVLEELATIHSW